MLRPGRLFVLILCRTREILLLLLFLSCSPAPAPPLNTPTPSPLEQALTRGQDLFEQKDYEGAALSWRDALNLMEQAAAPEQQLKSVREQCSEAMVKAGGFEESRQLWTDMAAKNPDSAEEAQRMVKRAERMMALQASELLAQSQTDLKEGHRQRALSTAAAAITLYRSVPEQEKALEEAKLWLKKLEEKPDSEAANPPPDAGDSAQTVEQSGEGSPAPGQHSEH